MGQIWVIQKCLYQEGKRVYASLAERMLMHDAGTIGHIFGHMKEGGMDQISDRVWQAVKALNEAEEEANRLLLEEDGPALERQRQEAEERVRVCREQLAQVRRDDAEASRPVL
jgi:hypothetical protein